MHRACFQFYLHVLLLLFSTNTLANETTQTHLSDLPGVTLVEGRQLPSLLQHSTSTVQVYAFHGDKPQPIPFQIDERDDHNRWALDQGRQSKSDDSPGVFDENDVLVLMHRDLGQ